MVFILLLQHQGTLSQLFTDKEIVTIILNSLDFLRQNEDLKIYAYVIMPEHIHFVASSEQEKITTLVGKFKSFTSRRVSKYLQLKNPLLFEKLKTAAYKGQNYAVWQETFRSELIYELKFLEQKINYLHNNPVRRGLVKDPGGWPHSSFNQVITVSVRGRTETSKLETKAAFMVDRLLL